MNEKALQKELIGACLDLKLFVFHDNDSRKNRPGLPDLIISGRGRFFMWELKGDRGKLSLVQYRWLKSLLEAGISAAVIYPRDLEESIEILAGNKEFKGSELSGNLARLEREIDFQKWAEIEESIPF